jgi:hypothetical protein
MHSQCKWRIGAQPHSKGLLRGAENIFNFRWTQLPAGAYICFVAFRQFSPGKAEGMTQLWQRNPNRRAVRPTTRDRSSRSQFYSASSDSLPA